MLWFTVESLGHLSRFTVTALSYALLHLDIILKLTISLNDRKMKTEMPHFQMFRKTSMLTFWSCELKVNIFKNFLERGD